MKSMRQQRYAMDLSEHAITIIHRAGAHLHLADALSRVGYSKQSSLETGSSAVAALAALPMHQCNLQHIKKLFEPMQDSSLLSARLRAVETGMERSFQQLSTKLEHK